MYFSPFSYSDKAETWRGNADLAGQGSRDAVLTEAALLQGDFKLRGVAGNWWEEINPELLLEFCIA